MELKGKEQKLLDLLTVVPLDFSAVKKLLNKEEFSLEEVTRVALGYVDACYDDESRFLGDKNVLFSKEIVPNLHSAYIVEVVRLLLPYGLEPNGIYGYGNIMREIAYMHNEYLGADALALLLENGGDPNLMLPFLEESVFESIDFDAFFGAVEQENRTKYDAWVHAYMVMIGYGAHIREDRIEVFKEYDSEQYFDLKKLRNHRDFYFGLTERKEGISISIYDKETLWEVVRIQ
ncbi:MAG: hypothetical protein IJD75_03105 [Clostridia bacterium]|nr:hypothetical protein [Clostridia bacterium]